MWSIDLRRRRHRRRAGDDPPDASAEALLLVRKESAREIVIDRCALAASAGVRRGMTVASARALLPVDGVRAEEEDPEGDQRALRALAEWAGRFSPAVATDGADGLLMDITGCERLFRGERRLVNRVAAALANLGFTARVASASAYGCAWGVARYGRRKTSLVPCGKERAALANLPVAALRLEQEIAEALLEVGVERVGELLDLPRSMIPARFGSETLLRIDQALGEAIEVIEALRPAGPVEAARLFDGPVRDAGVVERRTRALLDEICAALLARESGAGRLEIRLKRAGLEDALLDASLSRASREARHLWGLLAPKFERVHLGHGVEEITLRAQRIERLPHRQSERWVSNMNRGGAGIGAHERRAVGELLDGLAARLGRERVLRLEPASSHLPERATRLRPLDDASVFFGARRRVEESAIASQERPTILLERAERAEAVSIAPDGPPVRLRWRGDERIIHAAIGPERLAPAWWWSGDERAGATRTGTRDYFRVCDEGGRWLWVFREIETGRWFVHGLWA